MPSGHVMNDFLAHKFSVNYSYNVIFTQGLFRFENPLLTDVLHVQPRARPVRILVVVDYGVMNSCPELTLQICRYAHRHGIDLVTSPLIFGGGESAKQSNALVHAVQLAIHRFGLNRHSYVIVIGGGAVLDAASYAVATAQGGVRLIRVPSTVAAQNDPALGIKNGLDGFEKKNFLGTFYPPHAVINDSEFLRSLPLREWRAGIAEAIKTTLVRDPGVFSYIVAHTAALAQRNLDTTCTLIRRCVEINLHRIAALRDPYERDPHRALEFGEWTAGCLEQLGGNRLRYGEALAIGIAVDSMYSYLSGWLGRAEINQILTTLERLGFSPWVPETQQTLLLDELARFHAQVGNEFSVTLLKKIGYGFVVREVDRRLYRRAIAELAARHAHSARAAAS